MGRGGFILLPSRVAAIQNTNCIQSKFQQFIEIPEDFIDDLKSLLHMADQYLMEDLKDVSFQVKSVPSSSLTMLAQLKMKSWLG